MKKIFTNHFTALMLALLTSVAASAQSATLTASYDENYKPTDCVYAGQYKVAATGAVHAIGGGQLTCEVADLQTDPGYKLDSIKVSMSNIDGVVKMLSVSEKPTFNISTPTGSSRLSYVATAEIFTSNGNARKSNTIQSNTIYVYPEPVLPTIKAAGDNNERYDRGEGARINRSINDAQGANSTAWTYQWTVTYTDNGNTASASTSNYSGNTLNVNANEVFAVDQKTIREYTIDCEYTNMSPDGINPWIRGKVNGFRGLKIYNYPNKQPKNIGHFTDAETKQDFYLAMNLGINDATIASSDYQLIFEGSNGTKNNGTNRTLNNPGYAITNIYAQWTYNDGYVAPNANTLRRLAKPSITNLNYTATYSVNLNVGTLTGNNKYRQTPVTVGNVLNCYEGAQASATHNVRANGFSLTSSTVTSSLASNRVGSNRTLSGTNTWDNLTAGDYTPQLKVEGEFNVDTGQRYTLTCTRNASNSIKIWTAPNEQSGLKRDFKFSDIETARFNISMLSPTGGNPDGWDFYWERENLSTHQKVKVSTETMLTSHDPIDDPSLVMHTEDYIYRFVYTNLTPDGKDVWFTDAVDMATVKVYNAPTTPGSLLYMVDGDGYLIAATNLGLSDAMISSRKYSFKYDTGETIDGTRYYTGSKMPTQVNALWKYDDGRQVLSNTAYKVDADPRQQVSIRPNANGVTNYKGHVEDSDCIYALSGSKLTFNVDIDQNYIVETSNISINGDNGTDATTINGNSSTRDFYPTVDEITDYNVVAKIEVSPIFDSYVEGGKTQYIRADKSVALPELTFPKSIKIYPQPVYPQVNVEVVDWDDDNMATPKQLTIGEITGGTPDSWSYSWLMNNSAIGSGRQHTINSLPAIDGPNKTYDNYKMTVQFKNQNPLGTGNWVEGSVDFADINIYNVPNAPQDFVKYVNETNEYYVARGLGITDDQIRAQQYKLDFSGAVIDTRSYNGASAPTTVRTLIQYDAVGLHGAHTSYSQAATSAGTVTPEFTDVIKINHCNYDGQYGYTYRQDKNGYYALATTNADITLQQTVDRFTLRNGRLNINNQQATGSTLSYNHTFTESGTSVNPDKYIPTFTGEIAYQAEPTLGTQGYTTLPFVHTAPADKYFNIYPGPEFPDKKAFDTTQFRDIDEIAPVYNGGNITVGGGNINAWYYNWTYDQQAVSSQSPCYPEIPAQPIDGDSKKYEDHEFEFHLFNMSPVPDEADVIWMQNSYKLPVRIYNTPEKPTTLVKKGNGTSGIYIVNGMKFSDAELTSLQYRFEFGDGGSAVSTEEIGRRWYQYTSPQDPWVRSLWEYEDGYDCYSDITYADGSRGELSISDIMADPSQIQMVYTASGTALGKVDISDLQPGLYIIEYGEGDQRTIQKIYVK